MDGTPNSEDNTINAPKESETKQPMDSYPWKKLLKSGIELIDHHNTIITALATLVTAVATVVIAVLTSNYAKYAENQWMVMCDPLQEMRSSSTQTDRIVTNSTTQSKAAQISAETAQQTLIASQRAWLGPNDAKFDEAPVAGKKLGVSIQYHNTRREPARNVVSYVGT